ncbi:MAG TPA: RpiB/LacA/LacB family sugar-phosphate isomerase [Candidatus Saccharimonadales bacterium]|nr:RpiB/LacA/LacB family sugar-phosphate isomerase [Candidatus Saccharimonadales bacterium]
MKIYLGADHNGFEFKKQLAEYLRRSGYEVVDEGDKELRPEDDFPQFASKVVLSMRGDTDPAQARGILICGSGQGMCMAANRFKGIRAALAFDQEEARASRNDDDSNMLCLSSRYLDFDKSLGVVHTWLMTPFAGAPRFKRRIQELDELGN